MCGLVVLFFEFLEYRFLKWISDGLHQLLRKQYIFLVGKMLNYYTKIFKILHNNIKTK